MTSILEERLVDSPINFQSGSCIMAFEKLKNFVTSSAVNLSLLFLLLYFTSTETIVDCPNAFGMSPLMIAAQKGYTRFVFIRR